MTQGPADALGPSTGLKTCPYLEDCAASQMRMAAEMLTSAQARGCSGDPRRCFLKYARGHLDTALAITRGAAEVVQSA